MESRYVKILLALNALILFSLLSPKWIIPFAAWVAPFSLILLMKHFTPGKSFLVGWVMLILSGLIAQYEVMPFPFPVFIIMVIWTSLLGTLPYFLNRIIASKIPGWTGILLFPGLLTGFEYLNSLQGGGTLNSIAYTQITNLSFMQLASLSGIWGVTFMIGLFAALSEFALSQRFQWTAIKYPVLIYFGIIVVISLFGSFRMKSYFDSPGKSVKVAAVTANNLHPLLAMYEDAFAKKANVNIYGISANSPELQELNKGLAAFVENPMDKKFKNTWSQLEAFHDSLLNEATRSVSSGAKIISFSEALFFTIKPNEETLVEKAKRFSRDNAIFLLLPVASFIPGKIEPGKPFLENKAILIDDSGEVIQTFFKNKPVPLVEGSIPGNGTVPAQLTPYGKIATSICYDGDFPSVIRQAGQQHADILLLPSGDWKAISPYHSDVARVRAIENGFSILRPVSNAMTVACNAYGEIIGSKNFSATGVNTLIVDLPVEHKKTVYAWLGDGFAFASIALSIFLCARVSTKERLSRAVPFFKDNFQLF